MDILYVEDNLDHIFLFKRAVKKLGRELKCKYIDNGQEALDFVMTKGTYAQDLSEMPKVIILDINMHGISGMDVLQNIRNNPHKKSLPIIIFSTSDDQKTVMQAYDMGANAYVVKPNGFEDLTNVVRNMASFWLDTNLPVN